MKIGLVTPYFLPTVGGSELYVQDLAQFLKEKGHEVVVITTDVNLNTGGTGILFDGMVRRFRVFEPSRKLCRYVVSMYVPRENVNRQVSAMQLDILHYHNVADMTFELALWNMRIPKLLTCHTLSEVMSHDNLFGLRSYTFKKILGHMALLHVMTQRDISALKRLGLRTRVECVPPGIDVDSFHGGSNRNGNVVLFVGRISPEKGIDVMFEALSKSTLDFELWVVGPIQNERYFNWLMRRCSSSLKSKVKFFGHVSRAKLLQLYSEADIFVLPSRMETFGIVILEAMASKLPVISTCVGAANELVRDYENGFLVPVGSSDVLRDRIESLLADRSLRQKMGDKNRELVRERYSEDANFSRILELYFSLFPRPRDSLPSQEGSLL